MNDENFCSVIIPTYKRGEILRSTLDALIKQNDKNFEVLIILKPSNDGTEEIVKKYKNILNIKLFVQKHGYVVDALNIGLKKATGDIILFLDDDAIPKIDWLYHHKIMYRKYNVGGIAGNVIPYIMENNNIIPSVYSELLPNKEYRFDKIRKRLWSYPICGLNDHLIYISKSGSIETNYFVENKIMKTMLGMGANMSVLSNAVKSFHFPPSWRTGIGWEQYLAWYLWKKGYRLLYNPRSIVYHLIHGETLSRKKVNKETVFIREFESNYFFYRIYGEEKGLSFIFKIMSFLFSSLVYLKKMIEDPIYKENLKALLLSNFYGINQICKKRAE